MKKWMAALLALTLTVGLAACGNPDNNADNTTAAQEQIPGSALEILETVWNSYGEEEKFFVMGGDMEHAVENAPGAFSLQDVEGLSATLLVPAESAAQITEAASLTHAMNLNNFTCGVFRLSKDAKASDFADMMHKVITENRWMCGMPEQLLVATIGSEYVLAAFGLGEVMETFEGKLTAAYPTTDIRYNEAITG